MAIVHTGSSPPEFEWANAAVITDIHSRYEINKGRKADMGLIRKRRCPPPTSDDTRNKRRKTTPNSLGLDLRPPSSARLSIPVDYSAEINQASRRNPDGRINPTPADPIYDSLLETWAGEAFQASGNRRHVLGLLVSEFKIRFYYYDRAGAIYTQPLDIENSDDALLFVGAMISLSMLSPFDLGLEPFFAPAPRTPFFYTPSLASLSPHRSSALSWTDLSKVEGKRIHVDGQEFIVEDRISSTHSLFGRGTTVYGVRPVLPTSSEPPPSLTPLQTPPLRSDRRRQPFVKASSHHNSPPITQRLILKMSWQILSRQSEDVLLRLAEERGVQGVIRLYKSTVVGRLSTGLRGRMVPKTLYIDRELRIQILGPRCIPLKRVGDTADFKVAFRSLVEGELLLTCRGGLSFSIEGPRLHRSYCISAP